MTSKMIRRNSKKAKKKYHSPSKKDSLSSSKMESSTKANGWDQTDTVTAYSFGRMEPNTRANGRRTRLVGKESLYIRMVINTMDNGKTTKRMVLEFTSMRDLKRNTKVIGKTI